MSRATEASLISLGLAVALFGAALLWRATAVHPVDVTLVRVSAGILVAGLLLLPSVAATLAAGVKQLGSAVADAWRARTTPPGGPS